ncbi:MAG: type II CRISPR RNA-guided endonuclease Cas9 [Prevotella sp.]
MKEKYILGLDLGTNSIGWSVVRQIIQENEINKLQEIVDTGCRIIPMDAAMLSDFAKGNSKSPTAERTRYRGVRRLRERCLLRRERLHRVLSIMGFLPKHYADNLTRFGKFKDDVECKLPWIKDEEGHPTFLFKQSYNEMLQLFWQVHPGLMKQGMKVPYDWTIYYLRKKALVEAISGEELAWILLNFNQKRGYYQTRGEEQDEDKTKKEEYYALKVVDVIDTQEKIGKDTWYDVHLENGFIYHFKSKEKPDWIGKVKEFIVTTQLNEDGTPKIDKDGNIRRSFKMSSDKDWGLIKIKTQVDITKSGNTVGAYIFNALLADPKQKIKGKLVRTIERDFYKEELMAILKSQKRFISQLQDKELYEECIKELYQQNIAYRNSISRQNFTHLFVDDIIFYQRPLKSKKSLIDECPYESHSYIDKDGSRAEKHVKCIAKSNPIYQEFRLWQFIANLRIYEHQKDENGRVIEDKDVTSTLLPDGESRASLFAYLNDRATVTQKDLLEKYFNIKKPKKKDSEMPYRWNYVEDKQYPCNETRGEILKRLSKAGIDAGFLNNDAEMSLWHILYSVSDRKELRKALEKYSRRYSLNSSFVEIMSKFPPFESGYGSYSEKAIKRLLPLMRMGFYWNQKDIDSVTLERINKIIDGEVDESISKRAREKAISLSSIYDCQGLPLWLACYIVYDKHSEARDTDKWGKAEDIDNYLKSFKQHSLRNPVVEQVVTETLRVVRDIWKIYGHIDEIHLEMGRDMKNPADKRRKMTERAIENENANLRVKALLTEFLNPEYGIENVRPYSPSQQEILRIYEDTVLNSTDDIDDDIQDIIKKFAQSDISKRPTHTEVVRYKLWLEQHYVSPYTGQTIPLSRLFTTDYEIEHVIPQSRYFDDSLSNKVICEAAVNKLKDNNLGYEFVKKHHGEIVSLDGGRTVQILELDSYCALIEKNYRNNRSKMKKLLMEDIPSEFIERQLNDSRYISKFVKGLLSRIVREEDEQEAISKNLIVCSGSVTDRLKREWGINDVWNHVILPRFIRMNELTGTTKFTTISSSGHLIPDMPLELQKGFNKKRIDHRHHAMDAIVIACTTRDHVNLLSNEAASSKSNSNRYQLSHKLRRYEEVRIIKDGEMKTISVAKEFIMPWPTFPSDVEKALGKIIVSFKQNLRVITKTSNHSLRFVDGKKQMVKQTSGDNLAIRESMHKETVFGEVNLRRVKSFPLKEALKRPERILDSELKEKIKAMLKLGYSEKQIKAYFYSNKEVWSDIDLKKIEMYYFTKETSDRFFATRKIIDTSYDEKKIKGEITDTAVQKIMLNHLAKYDGKAKLAFSPDGIDDMNRNIKELNDGKEHQPIYKVRLYEKAEKFAVGQKVNKKTKFVEAAKGTNLFFAVYESDVLNKQTGKMEKKRSFRTIPLNEAICKMKDGEPLDNEALFILSPNDLVYVPTQDELGSGIYYIDYSRLYRFVSAAGVTADFIPVNAANTVYAVKKDFATVFCKSGIIQNEFGVGSPKSKNERAITGEMIKEICIPIKIDRLGHLISNIE